MKKEGERFLNEFIEDMYVEGNDCGNSIQIIRQNNILNMTREDFDRLRFKPGIHPYYHEYNHVDMMEAYEPFLDIIRDITNKYALEIDNIFDRAGVYSLHREIFKSYFDNGVSQREEELIQAEIDYEQERMNEGIRSLMKVLSDEYPIFIMLNKVNLITSSALTILTEFLEKDCPNIKIVGIVNQMSNISGYIRASFGEFMKLCEEKNCISDWIVEEVEEVEPDKSFALRMSDSCLYFRKIKNMLNMLAFNQAFNYLNFMYQRIELDNLKVSIEERVQMLVLYISACIFKKNYSSALLLCDSLKQLNVGELKKNKEYIYHYLVATANMCNGNQSDAKRYVKKCKDYIPDDISEFKVELLENMIELGGWNDICIVEKEVSVSQKLLDWCEKYKYRNHLAHIYVYCYDNDNALFCEPEGIEERLPMVMKGIRIAEELGNHQFMMEAYRKNVMLASYNGYNNTSNYFYGKIITVARLARDRMAEAHVYNGLGYNCSTMDNFVAANDYHNKALEIYYEQKSSDYIMETLYNMGMNAILSGDCGNAVDYLMTIQNVMSILKKTGLRVCNVSKLYGLTALAAFRMKKYHTVNFYLYKMKQFLEYILDPEGEEPDINLWDDDLFLYYYVTALLKQHEGDYDAALDNYEKSHPFMERSVGSKYFNYSQYVQNKANLYKIIGKNEERNQLLCDARMYFARKGNYYRVRMIEELISNGEWQNYVMEMPLRKVSLDDIVNLAKLEHIRNEAEEKKLDIRFFTTFQELVSHSYESVDAQTETLILSFKNNFNVDNVVYISCEKRALELRYSNLPYSLTEGDIQSLNDYFTVNTDGFAISKFSDNYYEYEPILRIFKRSKIFSVVAVPLYDNEKLTSIFIAFDRIRDSWNTTVRKKVMDENDLDLYRYIFRQIVDANEKFKLNEKLMKQAVTDELTGLLNRKGYYEKIDDLLKSGEDEEKHTDVALLYVDLDHFKYYNDTFGHHVGDALLIAFSKIFEQVCPDAGTAVRFGGDEFLMLLETADRDDIQKVVDELYYCIGEKDGFIDVVGKYVEGVVKVPEEHKVNCSIGIAYQKNIRRYEEYSDLRKNADAMLYKVKKSGKGYAAWCENK